MKIQNEVMQHLTRLSVEIGPRPTGSPANHAAAAYIRQVFQRAGLEVEELPFECPSWSEKETRLEVNEKSVRAAANMWSVSCDVTAPTIALCSLPELRNADLRNKITIFYGDLSASPLLPKGYTFYSVDRDREIIRLLEEKQPAALITVNLNPHSMTRIIEDWLLEIPSATVSTGDGVDLIKHAGQTVHLKMDTHRGEGHSAHIIAHKYGTRPEKLVFCAHYDTKIETPGAWDNGGGVSALLTLATLLAEKELPLTLEFIAFSDEEYTGKDDAVYMQHYGDTLNEILVAINMDGIGHLPGTNTIMMLANSDSFQQTVAEIVENTPGVIWTDPWPQSNHSTFTWRGVPAIAFTSKGVGAFLHEPTDTIEWMSADKLVEVISLVAEIVEAVQEKSLDWTRPAKLQMA